MKDKPGPELARKRGCSPVALILLGCGSIVLLGMVGACGLGIWGYRWGMGQLKEMAAEYEQQGYERVVGQVIEVSQPVDAPRVYQAQVLAVKARIDADVAIMCQVVEVDSTINGDVDFFGQVMVLKSGAEVNGDIRVKAAQVIEVRKGAVVTGNLVVEKAQAIKIRGDVQGEVTGSYQTLNWPNRPREADSGGNAGPPEKPSVEDASAEEPSAEEAAQSK